MKIQLIAGMVLLATGAFASAAETDTVSTEATPANNPSLRHNPVAITQAGGAAKGSLQTAAAKTQLRERSAYFDYNRRDLHTEDSPMLRVHATYLLAHPTASVKLVGHTDQRGSMAYNQALGEHRVASVRDYFLKQGIPASQIQVASEGPASSRHSEPAMAKCRRVDMEYL